MPRQPRDWHKKGLFVIEIDGIERAEFARCSPFRMTATNIEYKEGGRQHPHNAPGGVTFEPITVERGACDDFDLYNWMKYTYDAASGVGEVGEDLFRSFDVVQLNRRREEVERHSVLDGYCSEFDSGDWDNDANEVRIERAVITIDSWEKVRA